MAVEFPEWAYPAVPPHVPGHPEAVQHVPGSVLRFTQAQIDSGYEVADWYPDEHPPMPRIVSQGAGPPVRACAMCHLPSGAGHPETAGLAGQPVAYAMRQLQDMQTGARTGSRAASMLPIVRGATPELLLEASEYYAHLPLVRFTHVVETPMVPKTMLGLGGVRYAVPEGDLEPLGERIIEIPEDADRAHSRDSHSGFIAHVPPGSVARGEALLAGVASTPASCAACHGPALHGDGDVPGIAGRSTLSTFRALNDYQAGNRAGPATPPMRSIVAEMTQGDMMAIAAYLTTLQP